MFPQPASPSAEEVRLGEDSRRERFWKLWGTYLPARQWGTVREDYSADGDAWSSFPFEHAHSRAYRWGEDGLLGLCDRFGRLCFGLSLWNGRDPLLKERLFGLTGHQGNHGEDVKELYYFLDATPTHSYCKALYKYPQREFPYADLVAENGRRDHSQPEYELLDTGVFAEDRYFDVFVEYAKDSIDDLLIRVTVHNRGPEPARLVALPSLWYRNTWGWGHISEECLEKPEISEAGPGVLAARHAVMGEYRLAYDVGPDGRIPEFLFTDNETNTQLLYGCSCPHPFTKDAFREAVVCGRRDAVNPAKCGTKAAGLYDMVIPPGQSVELRMRLAAVKATPPSRPFDASFADIFAARQAEADEFYAATLNPALTAEERRIARQANAGLLWSKQFYYFVQAEWHDGDEGLPRPPDGHGLRNAEWPNLFNRDILSMPATWEYPYYCSWDLAFHTAALWRVDPEFCKNQLVLLLREWYQHPDGQIPAYEWNFSDANPPVHGWAALRLYHQLAARGRRDDEFLERIFQKLLLNFTWWVNRKDVDGNNLFAGGFLGFDNISAFDRSKPLPTGGKLNQVDGTAWIAKYCLDILQMALLLTDRGVAYEDMATKFIVHFARIVDAMNTFCGTGLWNEEDGFYYDMLDFGDRHVPLKIRSIVGFIPLLATCYVTAEQRRKSPGFAARLLWHVKNRPRLASLLLEINGNVADPSLDLLLTMTPRHRLERLLAYLFDEQEFLSDHGIRSVSKYHEQHPFTYTFDGTTYAVDYEPGAGRTGMFGGNSNWRGPVWMPINFMLIEALKTYGHFFGDSLLVEFPTGSGHRVTLTVAADLLAARVQQLFLPDENGFRPCHGREPHYAHDPAWKDLVLFHEYFHGDTGEGLGAAHQTGWTALVAELLAEKTATLPQPPHPAAAPRML